MQPQEMAAGFECDRKINLMDMLAFSLFKCDLPCYVRAEIKKDEPRPYLMGDHLPAFCMEIHGGYRVFECAERSFNSPSEMVYLFDLLRMKFIFRKVCYDVLIGAVPNGEIQDTQGYFVFPIPFSREIVKSYLFADVSVVASQFGMQVFLF